MKFAVLNDTHAGVRNDSIHFHEYMRRFYEEVFFPYCIENDIKHIVHLGDYFDKRTGINFLSLQRNKEHFIEHLIENDMTMDLTLGNHDLYYKNTSEVNSCDALLKYDNITIYKDTITKDYDGLKICLIPWIHKNNLEDTMEHLQFTDGQIAMGHLEIEGAIMMPGYYSSHGTSKETFKRFEHVYSGHFHTGSTMDNITYLGSQMEFTWSDYGDVKGFHIFDTDTREMTKIKNPIRMFEKIFYDDTKLTQEEILAMDFSHLKNMFTKVIVINKENPYWFDLFIEKLAKADVIDFKIVEDHGNLGDMSDEDMAQDAEDTLTILSKHIDTMEISQDKEKLQNIIRSLYTEALDNVS